LLAIARAFPGELLAELRDGDGERAEEALARLSFRTLRELALSYFEAYFNLRRDRTLRTYSNPVDLRRFDARDWMTSEKDVWFIPEYLLTIAHRPLLEPWMRRYVHRLDARSFKAGLTGHRWK